MIDTKEITKERLLEKAAHAGAQVAQAAVAAERVKERINHAVEDSVTAARRTARRTRYAAEDLVDETAYRIKREPLRAVAVMFSVGFGLGALTSLLITHTVSKRSRAHAA